MEEVTIRIGGMSCGGCVRSVRRALTSVPGVRVDDVTQGSATLIYDPALSDRSDLDRAITKAGYARLPD